MSGERWLPVAGYEGLYEVSDLGRVRSLDKIVVRAHGARVYLAGRVLYQHLNGRRRNYWAVTLHKDGHREVKMVHRLVAEAFLGPLPAGLTTRHGPAGSLENRLTNLSYGTQAENNADKFRDGTHPVGTGAKNAVLTEAIVRECRSRFSDAAETIKSLAAEFGISEQSMGKAVRGRTWRHVPGACGTYVGKEGGQ